MAYTGLTTAPALAGCSPGTAVAARGVTQRELVGARLTAHAHEPVREDPRTEICDGNTHGHDDMPFVLAGGGNGTIRSGRLLSSSATRRTARSPACSPEPTFR